MTLESLENYFKSSESKSTLQKAQLAYQISQRIESLVPSGTVKIILRGKRRVVLECENQALATTLTLKKQKIAAILTDLNMSEYKIMIRSHGEE